MMDYCPACGIPKDGRCTRHVAQCADVRTDLRLLKHQLQEQRDEIERLRAIVASLNADIAIHKDIHGCHDDMAKGYAQLQQQRDEARTEVERYREFHEWLSYHGTTEARMKLARIRGEKRDETS